MDLKDLITYQISKIITIEIYKIISKLPKEEIYNLADQMRRCTVSILANISESEGTFSYSSKINYLYISRASLYELYGYLLLLPDVYKSIEVNNKIIDDIFSLIKLLNTHIKRLSLHRKSTTNY